MHVYKTPDERYVIHANLTFKDKVIIMAWDDALAMKNSCAQRPGMHYLTMDDIQPTHTKALEKVGSGNCKPPGQHASGYLLILSRIHLCLHVHWRQGPRPKAQLQIVPTCGHDLAE